MPPLADRAAPPFGIVGDRRIALVHDYLLVMRGAERTFAAIAELYPDAPICTLLYDEAGTNGHFAGRVAGVSALQRLGFRQSNFRKLLPLYPLATDRLRVPDADVVISSSSAFAHGVRVSPGTLHICYCYTPFRYAWEEENFALQEASPVLRPVLRRALRRIRRWDLAASRRVDAYIAISRFGSERIKRCYGRDAVVIHPPVETHRFEPGEPSDALLVVSELVRHKRVQFALQAARRARTPIRVVGTGPDYAALRASHPEAEFLGRVDDRELADLYSRARAVLVPNVEEFGITAIEAQAAGRPVIAADGGGARETVLDGRTGRLARFGDVDAFAAAIDGIGTLDFDPAVARENAERFSVGAFRDRLSRYVARLACPEPRERWESEPAAEPAIAVAG